jgi:MarR family transcriptional regulator, lower aerobic nicotinate degradation pathway regulator
MTKKRQSSGLQSPAAKINGAAARDLVAVDRAPLPLARQLHQICIAATADTLAPEGLTNPHFGVLINLSRVTGKPGIDQITLAARMVVDRARASQLVDDLEAMGLVQRRVNETDRRAHMLWLTQRGERLRARLYPAVRAGQMRVLAILAPHERELLLDLLVRVLKANHHLARPGADRRKRGFRRLMADKNPSPSPRRS